MKLLITGANRVVNKVMLEKLVSMGYEVVALLAVGGLGVNAAAL